MTVCVCKFFFFIIVSVSLSICYFIVIFSPRLHFMPENRIKNYNTNLKELIEMHYARSCSAYLFC